MQAIVAIQMRIGTARPFSCSLSARQIIAEMDGIHPTDVALHATFCLRNAYSRPSCASPRPVPTLPATFVHRADERPGFAGRQGEVRAREGKQVCALLLVVHAACSGLEVERGVEMIGHGLTSGPRTAARLARPGS